MVAYKNEIVKKTAFLLVKFQTLIDFYTSALGCANKDLGENLGPVSKFINYSRIVALLPVIPFGIRNNW